MGAYENPIAVVDKSDEIMQAGWSSFSSSITNAFVKKQQKEEEFAKKRQQEALSYERYYGKNQAETEAEMERNKKSLGNLDEKWVNSGRDIFGRVDQLQATIDSSTDIDVVKKASADLRIARKSEANYMDAVTSLNTLVGTVSEQQIENPNNGKAGYVDRFDPVNKSRVKAVNALGGTPPSYKPMEINANEDGDIIATFYLDARDENGNSFQEEFNFNVTRDGNVEDAAKVSNLSQKLTTASTAPVSEGGLGILDSKGNLSDKYFVRNAENEIETKKSSDVFFDKNTGNTVIRYYEENEVDDVALNTVISNFVAGQVNGKTDKEKLSAFNNSFSGMVGESVTYQDPVTGNNVKTEIEDNSFDFKEGENSFTPQQSAMFTALTEEWWKSTLNTQPEKRKIGQTTVPPKEMNVNEKNALEGLRRLDKSGVPLFITSSKYIKKVGNKYVVEQIGTQLATPMPIGEYESIDAVIDQLPPTVDRAMLRKQLGITNDDQNDDPLSPN